MSIPYEQLPLDELDTAEHMDELTATDGTRYRVLISGLTGEKTVVRADVVEYSNMREHPFVRGVCAGLGLLVVLVAPPLLAPQLVDGSHASGAVSMAVGFMLFFNLLNRFGAGDAIQRMLEWKNVSGLALRSDTGEMT